MVQGNLHEADAHVQMSRRAEHMAVPDVQQWFALNPLLSAAMRRGRGLDLRSSHSQEPTHFPAEALARV